MAQAEPGTKFCFECGESINAKAEICPKCGVRQPPLSGVVTMVPAGAGRSRVGAALFAIFLGGLGIHKFYLGRVVQGIFYLLFCWTFIPALIGFIEGIIYLCMSDAGFDARYNAPASAK